MRNCMVSSIAVYSAWVQILVLPGGLLFCRVRSPILAMMVSTATVPK